MGFVSDLKVLYHLAVKPVRGSDHAARMESFYAGQAAAYDDFRKRLLQGRHELWSLLPRPSDGVWVDMGGGTGSNLEYFRGQGTGDRSQGTGVRGQESGVRGQETGDRGQETGDRGQETGDRGQGTESRLAGLKSIYVVDLSQSLLDIARQRATAAGWTNVIPTLADATTFRPLEDGADVVTFSYSLTMIPDWFAALENALSILRPGGTIGIVDFYVARKYAANGHVRHAWFTRTFWPAWFALDNVFPSPDHLPFLQSHFETQTLEEHRAKVPYIPLARVPYYVFVGRKAG